MLLSNQQHEYLIVDEVQIYECQYQWFLTRGEFPTKGVFEKFKGGILILHSENPKHCVLSCNTTRAANFQTLVLDPRLFVILQTFLLPLYICLKTKTFLHIPSQNHQQAPKNFDFILQKLSVTPDKNWKSVPTQLDPPVPGQVYGLR